MFYDSIPYIKSRVQNREFTLYHENALPTESYFTER